MENQTINIEEIMADIRREIAEKHLTPDMLSFEDVPYDKPGEAVNKCSLQSSEARNAMVYLHSHYAVQPYKPLSGNPVAVFVKKVIRKLTKFYIEPTVADQNEVNANIVRMLNALEQSAQTSQATSEQTLEKRLAVLELQQKQTAKELAALRKENAALRARLEEQ